MKFKNLVSLILISYRLKKKAIIEISEEDEKYIRNLTSPLFPLSR